MIKSKKEYEKALKLMSELIEDYDNNIIKIDELWPEIEEYEDNDPELKKLNELQHRKT